MKKTIFKKLVTVVLTSCMILGMMMVMTGCGSKTIGAGTYTYEKTVLNVEEMEIPAYSFGNGILQTLTRALKVDITLKNDGTYTMEVHGWMQEDTEGGTVPVGEAFPFGDGMYAEWFSTSEGTYTSTENTISIKPTKATYKIPDLGTSYLSQLFGSNAGGGSYNEEGENYWGEWSSDDIPEVLNQFPETDFIVENGKIVTWLESGYALTKEVDGVALYFYDDGTVTYRDGANKTVVAMQWSVEGEEVTVVYETTSYIQDANGDNTPQTTTETFTGSASQALKITVGDVTSEFSLTADDMTALSK